MPAHDHCRVPNYSNCHMTCTCPNISFHGIPAIYRTLGNAGLGLSSAMWATTSELLCLQVLTCGVHFTAADFTTSWLSTRKRRENTASET